jgi:Co/Zn/Cd efflux system component
MSRLRNPTEIDAPVMLGTAVIGVVVNCFMAAVLHGGLSFGEVQSAVCESEEHKHGHDHHHHHVNDDDDDGDDIQVKSVVVVRDDTYIEDLELLLPTGASCASGAKESSAATSMTGETIKRSWIRRMWDTIEEMDVNVRCAVIHVIGDLVSSIGTCI